LSLNFKLKLLKWSKEVQNNINSKQEQVSYTP